MIIALTLQDFNILVDVNRLGYDILNTFACSICDWEK